MGDAAAVPPRAGTPRRILVIDVGGTHVKLLASGRRTPIHLPSGPGLTPAQTVTAVLTATAHWSFDVVSIGYPGPVGPHGPLVEPAHLGTGWVGFDFERALGRPVRIINDAAMQALGGYRGGSMLFLGFGTGLGSALIVEGHIQPLELAHLPYREGRAFEDFVGDAARHQLGHHAWRRYAVDVINRLAAAMQPREILIGGGNARHLEKVLSRLPPGTRLGGNADAFRGGFRLWRAPADRARGA